MLLRSSRPSHDLFEEKEWKDERDIRELAYAEVARKNHGNKVTGRSRDRPLTDKQLFSTFQPKWQNFEKSRWTVTRQSSKVTRPSADCQTNFFRRFKQFGIFLIKVAERSRDSGRRSRDRRTTVQLFSTFQAIRKNFEKSRWTVTRQSSEVTRPSADCQTNFFRRFKQFGKFLKKVAERSRDSRRRSRYRRPTVKQLFFDASSNSGKFWKKSINTTVVGGHATVGRLSNNFFRRFKQFGKISKKVAEWLRESRLRSRFRK